MSIYPQPSSTSQEINELVSYKDKYAYAEKNTQSMYCPAANLVSPMSSPSTQLVSEFDQPESDKQPEVTLEQDSDGNSYLHLVLPATAVNFLNGHDPNSLFDVGNQGQASGYNSTEGKEGCIDEDYDEMLIEVGCKVYEINRVKYKSMPGSPQGDYGLSL